MKKVELVKGIHSSALGFGCAPVLGSVDAKRSKMALESAFERGVNHIDLARSYGYGEAERFVGKLLGSRRKDMVLASKFGIKANWKASLMRPFKPIIRKFRSESRPVTTEISNTMMNSSSISNLFHDRLELNTKVMKKSLEKSLKELGTDFLDYFFIHEPHSSILNINELLETANNLKKEGKIRAFGLSYMKNQEHLHKEYLNRFDILQFDNSPGTFNYDEYTISRGNKSNIIFSPLKGRNDLQPKDKLIKLIQDYPHSVILCSMFNLDHIRNNAILFD